MKGGKINYRLQYETRPLPLGTVVEILMTGKRGEIVNSALQQEGVYIYTIQFGRNNIDLYLKADFRVVSRPRPQRVDFMDDYLFG